MQERNQRMRKRSFVGGFVAAMLLSGVIPVGASFASGPEAQLADYVPIPGYREFTGRMIARPVQLDAWMEQGLSNHQAGQRVKAAQQAMTEFRVREHVWQTDDYIFYIPDNEDENAVANRLLATGNFQYVEPDWMLYPAACPNDYFFNLMWQVYLFGAEVTKVYAGELRSGAGEVLPLGADPLLSADTGAPSTNTGLAGIFGLALGFALGRRYRRR